MFGVVVPKRHAKRAVTRNLVKRIARETLRGHAAVLPAGLWLLRLRGGFAAGKFVSARSAALAAVLHEELERLLQSTLARSAALAGAGADPAQGAPA